MSYKERVGICQRRIDCTALRVIQDGIDRKILEIIETAPLRFPFLQKCNWFLDPPVDYVDAISCGIRESFRQRIHRIGESLFGSVALKLYDVLVDDQQIRDDQHCSGSEGQPTHS